ncbi:helix-turn-helix domain-containing protein [Gluconobacter cerinus]|uniref:helix-turn-helix domain-containing protein n=1 Tax=Gluconobacter cerinus TaxID=38307 RepID=UPI001B8A8E05|nr:helix-turn-helix domain-containing protein [Gluconobacter cerinus]MBS1032929.1 helix-turn-helix domain-containing protein [Gluconobacter cerinus]
MTSFASQIWTLTQARQITAKTHLVLQALASFEGHRGLFPSHESIAARAGCSTRTVIRALETAYSLGLIERTRQRMRRSGRVVNGPNRYRLIMVNLEQAKAAAAHAAQRLKEALSRRKLRFSSNCQNGSGLHFQRDIFFEKPRSKNDWLDLIASWPPSPSPS